MYDRAEPSRCPLNHVAPGWGKVFTVATKRRIGSRRELPLLIGALMMVVACSSPPLESETEPTPEPALVDRGDPAQEAPDRAETRKLEQRVFELDLRLLKTENELVACKAELDSARAENETLTAKRRRDLEGLVAREEEARPRPTAASAPTPRTAPKAWVRGYSGPLVQIVGERINVSGKLWNGGEAAADVQLKIMLYADGRLVDTGIQRLRVSAGTDTPYFHAMRARAVNGKTYLARIDIQ